MTDGVVSRANYPHVPRRVVILILCAIFFLGTTLRVGVMGEWHAHYQGDYARDYLVARHIAFFHEFPLTGPDGAFGTLLPSPLYLYLWAPVVLLFDDVRALAVANLFFQLAGIVLMFFIARNIFGNAAALFASAVWALSDAIVMQSAFPWQPYEMEIALLVALLFLVHAHVKKRLYYLAWALIAFAVAISFHYSALGIAPVFLAVAALVAHEQRAPRRMYAIGSIIFVASLVLAHAPAMWYVISHGVFVEAIRPVIHSSGGSSILLIVQHFFQRIPIALGVLLGTNEARLLVSAGILVAFTVLYFLNSKRRFNLYMVSMLMGLVALHMFVSLLPDPGGQTAFPDRYYLPGLPLMVLLIAGSVEELVAYAGKFFRITIMCLALIFVLLAAPTSMQWLLSYTRAPLQMGQQQLIAPFSSNREYHPSIQAVESVIRSIKETKQFTNLHFFSMVGYRVYDAESVVRENYADEVFWAPLEKLFDTKLVTLDDGTIRGWSSLGGDDYLFVWCFVANTSDERSACQKVFRADYPSYRIVQTVYETSPHAIYLATRTSL